MKRFIKVNVYNDYTDLMCHGCYGNVNIESHW